MNRYGNVRERRELAASKSSVLAGLVSITVEKQRGGTARIPESIEERCVYSSTKKSSSIFFSKCFVYADTTLCRIIKAQVALRQ